MPETYHQAFTTAQNLKRSFNVITLLGIVFLALIFSSLVYLAQTSRDTPVHTLQRESMTFEIEAALTLYQLSLAKIIIGEQTLHPERIDAHIQRAGQTLNTLQEGGVYRHQVLPKIEDQEFIEQLQTVQADILNLKTLGDQWMGLSMDITRDQDIVFDALFEDISVKLTKIKARLSSAKQQQIDAYDLSLYQLYGSVLFCALILLGVFYYSNRRYYQANQRLLVSEEKSRLLFNASVGISVTFNEQLLVQSFNKTAETTFGYSEAEIKGQPFHILLSEPYASTYFSDMNQFLGSGKTEIIGRFRQLVAQDKNRTSFPMDTMINTIVVDGQTLFVATARDISERLKHEQQTRDLETRTRAIVDSAVDGIITIDTKGLIETYNRAAETIFGYTASEVIGQNIKKLMPKPYAQEHDGYLANYLRTGKAKIIGIDREVLGLHKNGATFPMDLSIAAVKLGSQQIFTGIVRDITERKLAEDQLLEAKDEAERANHAKSDFLSRMSHELRTPLNAILGFSQILEMDALNPSQSESVHHIIKAGRHLTGLINEVLDIARIESGRQDLSLEPIQVFQLLSDVCHLMTPLASERSIDLEKPEPGQCTTYVIADLQRFKQVLINLLSNALKYNHDGGRVELFCTEIREGILRISVRDTGPGIAAEDLQRVFEPFERLDAGSKNVEGSGVGLALSKALVEAMGGILSVDSQVGQGSTFWLELGIIDPPSNSDTPRPLSPVASPEHDAADSATVLYIEDNIANFRLVEVVLSHRPHLQLITAMEGELGIELALRHQPDIILLDIHLPVLMGDQVLTRLRAEPRTQHIPVVVISADATQSKIDKLLAAGAHGYLTKPFNIQELLRTVDSLLATRRNNNNDNPPL